MEAILATFFGIDCNAQNDYNDPAFKAGRESLDPGPVRRFILFFVAMIPFGSYLVKYFPSFFIGQFQDLVHLTEKIIEARRQDGSSQRKVSESFLLLLYNDLSDSQKIDIGVLLPFSKGGTVAGSPPLDFYNHSVFVCIYCIYTGGQIQNINDNYKFV
jgi:hypothetical protein